MKWKKETAVLMLAAVLGMAGCTPAEEAPAQPVPREVQELEAAVTIGGGDYTGLYTGWVLSDTPEGQGTFTTEEGLVFTGFFSGGIAGDGEAENLPVTVTCSGVRYTGVYTGPVTAGLPEGEGDFTGVSALGLALAYTGGWDGGVPAGDGLLTAEHLTVPWNGRSRPGAYDGLVLDLLPHGEGTFRGEDGETSFTYTGQWQAGAFHGQGTLTCDGDNYYVRRGTFTQGAFTPTYLEALDTLGSCEPVFTLTEVQREFIGQFPGLWSEETDRRNFLKSDYQALYERNYYQQLYFQDPGAYETAWVRLPSLRLIDWQTVRFDNGLVVNRLTAANDGYTLTYQCYLVGEITETLKPRGRVDMYAMPVSLSTYTNTLGEDVTCAVVLVGDIRIR